MNYENANTILPEHLVEELQKYIQGEYLYIPVKKEQRKQWGERSGYRQEIAQRNLDISKKYAAGLSPWELAYEYHLSVYTIRKIIYKK